MGSNFIERMIGMKVTSGTIARTVVLALALINQVLTVFGYNVIDISTETINTLISTIFTVITALVAFWKNNSFTKAAIEADEVMRELKAKE